MFFEGPEINKNWSGARAHDTQRTRSRELNYTKYSIASMLDIYDIHIVQLVFRASIS